jgi:hypothetical protein
MKQKIEEFGAFKVNGFLMLAIVGGILGVGLWYVVTHLQNWSTLIAQGKNIADWVGEDLVAEIGTWVAATFLAIGVPSLSGFVSVEPNQAVVLILFGKYIGSVRDAGFWWTNPFASKHTISLRVRNFNSKTIKVNDAEGSPIEIAAVVVWQVFNLPLMIMKNLLPFKAKLPSAPWPFVILTTAPTMPRHLHCEAFLTKLPAISKQNCKHA